MKKILCIIVLMFSAMCVENGFADEKYTPTGKTEYVIPYSLQMFAKQDDEIKGFFSPMCSFYSTIDNARAGKPQERFYERDYSLVRFYISEHNSAFSKTEELYILTFEDGSDIYVTYRKSGSEESSIESISSIRTYTDYCKFEEAVGKQQEVYPNTGIFIEKGEFATIDYYTLNNGVSITSDRIAQISNFLNFLNMDSIEKQSLIAKTLLSPELASVDYKVDTFDDVAYIFRDSDYSLFQIYLVFKSNKCYPRVLVKYRSDTWLFLNAITLGTDNLQWDCKNIDVNTQVLDGSGADGAFTLEKADFVADEQLLNAIRSFLKDESIRIRFRGNESYVDKTFKSQWLETEKAIVSVYDIFER